MLQIETVFYRLRCYIYGYCTSAESFAPGLIVLYSCHHYLTSLPMDWHSLQLDCLNHQNSSTQRAKYTLQDEVHTFCKTISIQIWLIFNHGDRNNTPCDCSLNQETDTISKQTDQSWALTEYLQRKQTDQSWALTEYLQRKLVD